MRIVATVRDTEPDAAWTHLRVPPVGFQANRARLAALRTRAPDTLRARIRRELRAAARRTAQR
jgi:hypothetical protein